MSQLCKNVCCGLLLLEAVSDGMFLAVVIIGA